MVDVDRSFYDQLRAPMMQMKQIGPIVGWRTVLVAWAGKQTVLDAWTKYEEEEIPDRSGPDLYRAMRGYPRMGSGDRCGAICSSFKRDAPFAPICSTRSKNKLVEISQNYLAIFNEKQQVPDFECM
jgi:hypothetical protein